MLIGELANAVGLPSQTIRFYERKGLLPAPERGVNGYRTYDESTLARLRFVQTAQAAGLTSPRSAPSSTSVTTATSPARMWRP